MGCNRKLLLPKGIYCWCYRLLLDVRAVYYGPSHQARVAASSTQMASWQRVGTKCGWLGGWMDALVVVLDGHGFVRKKGEGAIVEHCWGKLAHDGEGLEVQVPHHGVAVPSSQHFD